MDMQWCDFHDFMCTTLVVVANVQDIMFSLRIR